MGEAYRPEEEAKAQEASKTAEKRQPRSQARGKYDGQGNYEAEDFEVAVEPLEEAAGEFVEPLFDFDSDWDQHEQSRIQRQYRTKPW